MSDSNAHAHFCHMPKIDPPPNPREAFKQWQATPFGAITLLIVEDRRALFACFTPEQLATAIPNTGFAQPFFVGLDDLRGEVEKVMKPVDMAVYQAAQQALADKAAELGKAVA